MPVAWRALVRRSRVALLPELPSKEPGDEKQGDADVDEIIEEAVRYLGLAIANIDNFVKPECVAIECRLFDNLDNREKLMREINRNLYRKTYNDFRFTFMKGDELSGARGAAAVAIKNDLENYIE